MASCWVSVEPPCETPRCRTLATAARAMPIGIDAVMRIEAAVLDGDEGLRQIGRQILQRDIGAGHFAARRQHAAVEADDLDRRRPLWDFQRLDRRQMRADPDHDADDGDRRPQAEHRAPIDQPAEAGLRPRDFERRLAPLLARARLALARRLVVGSSSALRLADGFLRLVVAARRRDPAGSSRSSASAAASPNSGSLRPPLFFRPHAIRKRRSHRSRRTLAGAV